jgi:broad specificity phosphatase PhoE
VVPGKSSDLWPLSAKGRQSAQWLADDLYDCGAKAVVTSREPKAIETGSIIAESLRVQATQADGLHEHERKTVPHLRTGEFISSMAQVFRRKDDLVLGEETAAAALSRFRAGLDAVLKANPDGDIVVVAHGTVIALLLEAIGAGDGFQFWRDMGLPSYAVLEEDGTALRLIDGPVNL